MSHTFMHAYTVQYITYPINYGIFARSKMVVIYIYIDIYIAYCTIRRLHHSNKIVLELLGYVGNIQTIQNVPNSSDAC